MRNIIKTRNRRFYDRQEEQFITASKLLSIVSSGENVYIESQSDGKDLTRETLLDLWKKKELQTPLLTVERIAAMIRSQV